MKSIGKVEELTQLATVSDVVLVWSAIWCGPCRTFKPRVDEIAKKFPKIAFRVIDVEAFSGIADRYRISSMPTTIYLRDGKIRGKALTGAESKTAIEKWVRACRG